MSKKIPSILNEDKKILSVRKFKVGYEIREEEHLYKEDDYVDPKGIKHIGKINKFVMKTAYTSKGEYIGHPKDAYRFYKMGIVPQYRLSTSKVCSIGYCAKEKKWYGWSHRAMFGFKVGSKVQMGDCAFNPSNKEEFIEKLKMWENDIMGYNARLILMKTGVKITNRVNKGLKQKDEFKKYPKKWGKGEWTAKTLEDAKQMACDYAESVS